MLAARRLMHTIAPKASHTYAPRASHTHAHGDKRIHTPKPSAELSSEREKLLRLFKCEIETIMGQPANGNMTGTPRHALGAKETEYLEGLASKGRGILSEKDEAETFAIYIRVIRSMEELDAKLKARANGESKAIKSELARLSKAKGLIEGMVVNAWEAKYLRECAAERGNVLTRELECAVCTIYRRLHPRIMNLMEIRDAEKEKSGPAEADGAANRNPGLLELEIRRLSVPKKFAECIVVQGLHEMVWKYARKMRHPPSISKSDLVQEGEMALIEGAMPKFNPAMGYRLSTYGMWWVRQAMGRYIVDQGRDIRRPVHIHEAAARVENVSRSYRIEFNREPTIDELVDSTGLTRHAVERCLSLPQTVSMNMKLNHGDGSERVNLIPDTRSTSPFDAVLGKEAGRLVNELLSGLDPRHANVLRMRFGVGCKEHTLEEVGDLMDFTRERARQIQTKAISNLRRWCRKRLCEYYGGEPPCYQEHSRISLEKLLRLIGAEEAA